MCIHGPRKWPVRCLGLEALRARPVREAGIRSKNKERCRVALPLISSAYVASFSGAEQKSIIQWYCIYALSAQVPEVHVWFWTDRLPAGCPDRNDDRRRLDENATEAEWVDLPAVETRAMRSMSERGNGDDRTERLPLNTGRFGHDMDESFVCLLLQVRVVDLRGLLNSMGQKEISFLLRTPAALDTRHLDLRLR